MKARIPIAELETANNQKVRSAKKHSDSASDLLRINNIAEILASEGNESFRHYIDWLGLSRDPKLVVLSSVHHYYYDAEEMINVRTVVNLRELNQIKEINSFLHSMFQILPARSYLIGCFVDNKRQSLFSFRRALRENQNETLGEEFRNGIRSRIPLLDTIFSFLDARTNKFLTGKNVNQLLGNNGFRVMDMTELDGLTYFCAQSQRSADN